MDALLAKARDIAGVKVLGVRTEEGGRSGIPATRAYLDLEHPSPRADQPRA